MRHGVVPPQIADIQHGDRLVGDPDDEDMSNAAQSGDRLICNRLHGDRTPSTMLSVSGDQANRRRIEQAGADCAGSEPGEQRQGDGADSHDGEEATTISCVIGR